MITKEQLLKTIGEFTYCWGYHFFIQTEFGNFHWKDPDYQGDNTITLFEGNSIEFCIYIGVSFSRCKGKHLIENYCGRDFKLVNG